MLVQCLFCPLVLSKLNLQQLKYKKKEESSDRVNYVRSVRTNWFRKLKYLFQRMLLLPLFPTPPTEKHIGKRKVMNYEEY